MGVRVATSNFTKGEVSPEVEARFDLDVYKAALRTASNVVIKRTGGVGKRPGSRIVVEALSSLAKLIPFQFSDDQAYALEFGQAYMRPLAFGGAVLETDLKITAITKATNAKITCAYHGYSAGDLIYFRGISGMVEMNDRFGSVQTVPDANNFTVNIDSTGFSTFTSATGTVNGAPPPPPPPPPAVPPPIASPTPPTSGSPASGGYDGAGIYTDGGLGDRFGDGAYP